jgi:hypothetical protein
LGERLLCKQEVTGSIPVASTSMAPEPRGPTVPDSMRSHP